MSTAKKRALEAISELPDDADPQQIIKSLYRIYQMRSELLRRRSSKDKLDAALPADLQLVDGLLVYTGPLGGIPDDPVLAARDERGAEILE